MSNPGNTPAPTHAVVAVQSAWYSKVNWIAGIGAVIGVLNEAAPILPPKWQHPVSVAVFALTAISVIYTRTFASATVTPAGAAQAPVVTAEQALDAAASQAVGGALRAAEGKP